MLKNRSHRRRGRKRVASRRYISERAALLSNCGWAFSRRETADQCLEEVVEAVARAGGISLITADHGNAEQMLAEDGQSPHTAHTTNPVPLILTSEDLALRSAGELSDLIPTVLDLLEIEQPPEMTGRSLVKG